MPPPAKKSDTQRLRGTGPNALFSLSDSVLELVHEALETLLDDSRAKCAMVVDRTGVILASAGDFHPLNPSTMGATAAATIAALNSMVARASSPEVSVKFYGADVDKIHFVLIDERLVLCLLHSRHATSGQVRTSSRTFVTAIQPHLEADKRAKAETDTDLLKSLSFIEQKLDKLFGEPKA
jgi:hypothetical protein